MKQILFVCLGNICRSPSAEAVFNAFIAKRNLGNELSCDSAGTDCYHAGQEPDGRMKRTALKRGYRLTGLARKVNSTVDFERFDLIVGMDRQNIRDLKALARNEEEQKKICLMTTFCSDPQYDSVPDPYYGGDAGFNLVLDILEDACDGLLQKLSPSGQHQCL